MLLSAAITLRPAFDVCVILSACGLQGECKYTLSDEGHNDWVSSVRFPPSSEDSVIVSAGWDKVVKVWRLANCKLKATLSGHTGYLNTVTVSPDGSLCASGGKDKTAILWDLNECKRLYSLEAGSTIHALTFSPNRYWLVAATDKAIKVCFLFAFVCVFLPHSECVRVCV